MTLQQWKWGLIAAVVLAIITSLPQIYLCYERGLEWNGAYIYSDPDEFAYSAYVNALIAGRPRRNDPFSGTDDSSYETLFSIQFIPAYSIAIAARIFGVSTSTAFISLVPIVTIASALMLFFFLFEFTQNSILSAVGAIGVLCFGVLTAQAPWEFPSVPIPFPFLRRYVPAFPFPFFFAMALFVWRSLVRNSLLWSVFAGLTLIVLIYSYFFLWTAAVAWLTVLMILWLLARPADSWIILRVFGVIAFIGAFAIVPYLWLLAHRAPVIEQAVLLESTHRPDLFRGPELYGFAIVIITIRLAMKHMDWPNPKILFTLSLAVTPILVFNHQVLTGRSLQPFHYEWYIANYWILTALFLVLGLMRRNLPKRVLFYLAIGGLVIGVSLGGRAAFNTLNTSVEIDKGLALALKLKGSRGVVFTFPPLTHTLATSTSNGVLWSHYLYYFSAMDSAQRKLRFYKYLYYSGVTEQDFRALFQREGGVRGEIFGAERANEILAGNPPPITPQEIERANDEYRMFCSTFNRSEAASPLLSYAVVTSADNLSNLDKWYERDVGEPVGDFIIYRLRLK
jgi:hypothetical protein